MSGDSRITDPAEIQRILEERADVLARPVDVDDEQADVVSVVVVALGAERYGIDLANVREIMPMGVVTPVTGTPPYWLGLVNIRGAVFPVLALQRYLGTPIARGDMPDDAQIVLVAGAGITIGLCVDMVQEVRTLRPSEIGPSLVPTADDRPHVYAGLTNDLLAVLNMEGLLSDPSLVVRDAVDEHDGVGIVRRRADDARTAAADARGPIPDSGTDHTH